MLGMRGACLWLLLCWRSLVRALGLCGRGPALYSPACLLHNAARRAHSLQIVPLFSVPLCVLQQTEFPFHKLLATLNKFVARARVSVPSLLKVRC